jgi:hypothetical protein
MAREAVDVEEEARARLGVSGASKAVNAVPLLFDLIDRVGDGGGEGSSSWSMSMGCIVSKRSKVAFGRLASIQDPAKPLRSMLPAKVGVADAS